MIPCSEPEPPLDLIVQRLNTAGWLTHHRFQEGRGYVLKWTTRGRLLASLLQDVIVRHRLGSEPRMAQLALLTGDDPKARDLVLLTRLERDFWGMCLEELGIGAEESSLAALARAFEAWRHPGTAA